jgi:uncharacterized membrane protein YdbT with pleckstrin-like domain
MDLQPGERVIYEGHPSWRSTLGFYILGLLLAAAAAAIAYFAADAGIAAAVGGGVLLVVLIAGWLRRITTRYLITNRRLQIRHGILSKNVEHTRVDRIVDVTVRQSLFQRMLAIGAVDFDNASGGQGGQDLFRFTGIASPYVVTQAISEVQEQETAAGGRAEQQTGV